MFTRHIGKFNSAEAMQAAIQAGKLASPYVAYNVSSNVVNLVLPEGDIPATIEYSREGDDPVPSPSMYLVGSPSVDYIGGGVFLRGQIHFGAGWTDAPEGYESAVFGVVPADKWAERAEELGTDSSAEIIESFLNPESETYEEQYIADEINTRSADGSTGSFKSSDDLEIGIPYENEAGYDPETDYYIIGGFYPQGDTDSTYSYNLGKYVLENHLTDDPELIEFFGVINSMTNDEFDYWGGITQNDIYPRVAVGFYFQSVFDASFQAAYALDNTLTEEDFMNETFRYSSMVDLHEYTPYDDGEFYGFDSSRYSVVNYPGFSREHGEVLKMIGWWYDENDDPGEVVELYSQPTLPVTLEVEDNWATVTTGDNFYTYEEHPAQDDSVYDFIVFKVLSQSAIDEMVQEGYISEDADDVDIQNWLQENNAFDGSLGEEDSSTFEFDTSEDVNKIYIVGAFYGINEEEQSYLGYYEAARYVYNLNAFFPDSSTTTNTYQIYDMISHNNDGFYDSSAYVTPNTVVVFNGNVLNDGEVTHGIWEYSSVPVGEERPGINGTEFRLFGAGGMFYYDRGSEQHQSRINGGTNDGSMHICEYGNYYIKVDGQTAAITNTVPSDDANAAYSRVPIGIFGAYHNAAIDTANGLVNLKSFKIYDGSTLVRDFVPAVNDSSAVGLLDRVSYKFFENQVQGEGVLTEHRGFISVTTDASGNVVDTSTDLITTGYKFTLGEGNAAYFNSGYVPNTDTVVQFKGVLKKSQNGRGYGLEAATQGNYCMAFFGYHYPYDNTVYFEREGYNNVCESLADVDSATHEYEFGNCYINVDGSQLGYGNVISSTNDADTEFYIFALGDVENGGIKSGLAPAGSELEYIKFLEPDGEGGLELMMDLRPALDADNNPCLLDMVNGDLIHTSGGTPVITVTALEEEE